MFTLQTDSLPPNADALREAIESSLLRVVQPAAGEMVSVEDRNYPELSAIRVSLDGASAGHRAPPRFTVPNETSEPALRVEQFEISGDPVRVREAAIKLNCHARDVEIGQGRDSDGKVVLLLRNAAEGEVEIGVALADLEALVLASARAAAAQHGVSVETVQIELHARSAHALDLAVHVRAKKLFLSAALRISGSAEIDGRLMARLSGLECSGEGALGSLACGFIAPHLERFNEREFPLMALPLGEVKLRDVQVATGRDLRVTARFGGAA